MTEPPDLRRTRRQRQSSSGSGNIDRLPPHSPEAEQGVLGCVLLSPNDSMGECIDKLKSGAEAFYDLRHQTIFGALAQMYDNREAIDLITLQQCLKNKQLLDEVGGIAYLAGLPDTVPSAANLTFYLDIVLEKYLLRKMIRICTEVVGRVYDYEGEVDGLMDKVERDILSIRADEVKGSIVKADQMVKEAIRLIEDIHQRQGTITGISSGFPDLDKMTGGFQNGDMIVIAARPSLGKTSLAMNIAEHVAVDQRLPVAVFSLEMTYQQLSLRLLCSRARVNLRNVRDGFLAERDFPKLTGSAGKISKSPLYVDDSSGLSIMQLRARARRLWQQYGIKLFVIDYLGLLNAMGGQRRQENRQQEVADISCGIKGLAKELQVPVIVLSQITRDIERDKSRKPRLSDLRESGAIEQDADVVGFLYYPKSEDDDNPYQSEEAVPVNLLIAKQRNGPTGDVNLTFLKQYTRFESAAKVSDYDVPHDDRQADLV